jgi:hypothetical protein
MVSETLARSFSHVEDSFGARVDEEVDVIGRVRRADVLGHER